MDLLCKKLHFGRARAHVQCPMWMKLGTPLQNDFLETCTNFHPYLTPNMYAGVSETQFFTKHMNGSLMVKNYVFRTRPRTCSVLDGDETWYDSPTSCFGEAYQVSSPSDTERVCGWVRNAIFY